MGKASDLVNTVNRINESDEFNNLIKQLSDSENEKVKDFVNNTDEEKWNQTTDDLFSKYQNGDIQDYNDLENEVLKFTD